MGPELRDPPVEDHRDPVGVALNEVEETPASH